MLVLAPNHAAVADQQSGLEDPQAALQQVIADLDENRTEAALDGIERLVNTDLPPAIHHTALVLRQQISGQFRHRQSFWVQRQVVDRVVLVPDEASFFAAVQMWTEAQYWPILIEDGWFASLFIDAFKPREVVRWEMPNRPRRGRLLDALAQLIQRHNESFDPNQPPPPGMIALDPTGRQWAGGLALALGRGQPVHTIEMNMGHRAVVDFKISADLNHRVMKAANNWNLVQAGSLFGVTLAGDYPYRYRLVLPLNAATEPSGRNRGQPNHQLLAVDDLLGRIRYGDMDQPIRFAVVGRLIGDQTQSVYQAMCSLFVQPEQMLWVDTYAERGQGSWGDFRLEPAVQLMDVRMHCDLLTATQATVREFRLRTRPVNPYGLIWINSSGGPKHWEIKGGGGTADFPLGVPTIMHVVHSHSMSNPWAINTLSGRAIAGGAYWYYGAVKEPFLHSFNRPTGIIHKVLAGTPIAFAARQVIGQMASRPWRLMLVGDPLYTLRGRKEGRVIEKEITGSRPVTAPDGTRSAHSSLADAALVDQQKTPSFALICLKQAENLEPADVIRATWALFANQQYTAVAALPVEVVDRHPLVGVLVGLSRQQLDRQVPSTMRPRADD